MKTIYLNLYAFFLLLGSCDSFADTDLPDSQLTSPMVFENATTSNAAMTDIYTRIRDNGLLTGQVTGLSNLLGVYTDELAFYGNGTSPLLPFYNNALIVTNNEVGEFWNSGYSQVYAANAIIEGVAKSTSLTEPVKNQLTGEALFVRALLHLYLANLYGDIPYITTTDYRTNSTAVRIPISTVYENIRTDLENATGLLPEAYVNAQRTRPNRAAAHALLARLYMFRGAWAEASNQASAVLNSSDYVFPSSLEAEFGKDSPSTIWQLAPRSGMTNTLEAQTFIFTSGPPPMVALSEDLMAAFETGDGRKAAWTKAVTGGLSTWYHANKYKQLTNTAASLEYSIVLRTAEMYLIRAEARARQGEIIGAREDLNVIRRKAGLLESQATTADAIITDAQKQHRLEFFTEFGHRFFELKRQGDIDAVLQNKPGWESRDKLFPIPEKELLVNPALRPQNPGY